MNLSLLGNQIINAFTLGGIYALIAVGYTMVYGILKLINFAHGEIYMLGAFVGILFIGMGVPFVFAMLLAMVVCACVGVLIDFIAYRPLRNAPRLAPLITAIGISLLLQNAAMLIWSAAERPFPELYPAFEVTMTGKDAATQGDGYLSAVASHLERRRDEPPRIRDLRYVQGESLYVRFVLGTTQSDAREILRDIRREILSSMRQMNPTLDLDATENGLDHVFNKPVISFGGDPPVEIKWKVVIIWVVTIVLMLALETVIRRTKVGKAMRACALDKTTAALMGVDVNRIIGMTFAIGSAMAAAAGILFGLYRGSGIGYRMGFQPGVIAFSAAVLGGIGNIRGAMLGGIILGVVQVFSSAYVTEWLGISSNYEFAFAFGLLILVILVRPAGLLGKASAERA